MNLKVYYLFAAAILSPLAAFQASAETIVFQNGVSPDKSYKGSESSFIMSGRPTTAKANEFFFGTNGAIINVNKVRALVSFDISAIPANATIRSASLSIDLAPEPNSKDGNKTVSIDLMGMTDRFTGPGGATWNTSASLYLPTPLATSEANPVTIAAGDQVTFASKGKDGLTAFLQNALAANKGKVNLMVKLPDALETPDPMLKENQRYTFRAQPSQGNRVSQRPKLTVEYTVTQ